MFSLQCALAKQSIVLAAHVRVFVPAKTNGVCFGRSVTVLSIPMTSPPEIDATCYECVMVSLLLEVIRFL